MENRNFISGLVENLFWLLPLLIIFILLDYLYAIFLIITIGYIFYLLLDPLVCRLERIIRIRFLSVFIVISIFIAPIYFGFSSLAHLISNEYGTGAPTIRAKRMFEAFELSGEDRFKHPDEEEWKRIVKEANVNS